MLILYVLLIAGGALGRYRGSYESRNLIQRDEPDTYTWEAIVECPVCGDSNEECLIDRDGNRYKRCEYGVYKNTACGNRTDCYRGPAERCTKMTIDLYDQRCMHGYYCHPYEQKCTGSGYAIDSNRQMIISPVLRYPGHARNPGLEFPIRARRDV